MKDKVLGAIAIPKASWGCAPALPNRMQVISLRIIIFNHEPQANKKFFDPTIFQKYWRGSGRVALIAARRQRNPRAILLAHGGVVRKARAFRGGANKTAPPCETLAIICYLAIVPMEQLQRKFLTENLCS